MPSIKIEFECSKEEARRRAASGNGEVNQEGNYVRREEIPPVMMGAYNGGETNERMALVEILRRKAADDPEADVASVSL